MSEESNLFFNHVISPYAVKARADVGVLAGGDLVGIQIHSAVEVTPLKSAAVSRRD